MGVFVGLAFYSNTLARSFASCRQCGLRLGGLEGWPGGAGKSMCRQGPWGTEWPCRPRALGSRRGGLRASCRPVGILTEVEDVDVSASTLLQCPFTSFFCVWHRVWPLWLNSSCHSVSSVAQLCPTLCGPMNRSTPGLPVHHQLLESAKPMSIKSVMPSNYLILCRPLLLLPSTFPSIRVFSSESALHIRWPKYWRFSFNISPSNEHPGLISFSMDWLDLLAVQRTLERLLHHNSSKASILRCSAF